VATFGPVAIGVMLAFAWNLAMSQPRHAAADESGVTPRVGHATQQAWTRASQDAKDREDRRQGTRQGRSG
jgi:hypothetical protein